MLFVIQSSIIGRVRVHVRDYNSSLDRRFRCAALRLRRDDHRLVSANHRVEYSFATSSQFSDLGNILGPKARGLFACIRVRLFRISFTIRVCIKSCALLLDELWLDAKIALIIRQRMLHHAIYFIFIFLHV